MNFKLVGENIRPYIEGPMKLINIGRNVYLQSTADTYQVGSCNCKVDIDLTEDPSSQFQNTLDLFDEALTSELCTLSPSKMLHHIAYLCLSKVICKFDIVVEPVEEEATDLALYECERLKYRIDISGESMKFKWQRIKHMKEKERNRLILNKYKLLNTNKGSKVLNLLIKWSKRAEQFDVNTIYNLDAKQSKVDDQGSTYNTDISDLFFKGKDNKGRSIQQYHDCALQGFYRYMSEDRPDKELKISDDEVRAQILRLCKEIDQKSPITWPNEDRQGKLPIRDTEFFCFPISYQSVKEQIDREDKNLPKLVVRNSVELLDNSYVDHKAEGLFEYISIVRVRDKAWLSLKQYHEEKIIRDQRVNSIIQKMISQIEKPLQIHYILSRLSTNYGVIHDMSRDGLKFYSKKYNDNNDVISSVALGGEYMTMNSCISTYEPIDPDHYEILKREDLLEIAPLLAKCRDYHEARFRARVCLAIGIARKPNSKLKVKHWRNEDRSAEIVIRGLLFEKDKGVAYISYFTKEILHRTEKWRLPDIENYSVAHHRIFCMITSMVKNKVFGKKIDSKNIMKYFSALTLHARIINENSWGLSKFLKVYRYFAISVIVKSPLLAQCVDKLIKTLDSSVCSKLSLKMMSMLMMKKLRIRNKTPTLSMSMENIGWDCFMVNLCPSKTYGKTKHLSDTITELYDEIDLYTSHKDDIRAILFDNFDDIMRADKLTPDLFYEYYKTVGELAKRTDNRFTGGPVSVLLVEGEIQKINDEFIRRYGFHKHHIRMLDLMTARASTDSESIQPMMAIESMKVLMEKYQTKNLMLLILHILDKEEPIDLTMRMFDKDQIGGNREISILSNEFRLLQVCCEYFARNMAYYTDNEMLNRIDKINVLAQRTNDAMKSEVCVMTTMDQTRWGPNFNTKMFSLMTARFNRATLDSYIPTLVNYISENKIFECPPICINSYDRAVKGYTLMGKVGQSHMGQGIFHVTSSLFHSLSINVLTRTQKMVISNSLSKEILSNFNHITRSMITSDDVALFDYIDYNGKNAEEVGKLWQDRLTSMLSDINRSLNIFGIKTSEYKNIISSDYIEFNSEFLTREGIGSNEIKFAYALIDPGTTGNILNDYTNVLNSYYSSVNSGCSRKSAQIICLTNYAKMLRQWKLRSDILGFPSNDTICYGMLPLYDIDPSNESFKLETPTWLKYESRDRIDDVMCCTGTDLSKAIIEGRVKDISYTRDRVNYRSILTYNKTRDNIITCSDFFKTSNAIGESAELFIYRYNLDYNHIFAVCNSKHQSPFIPLTTSKATSRGKFAIKVLKSGAMLEYSVEQIISSMKPIVKSITNNSSMDETTLHLIRNARIGDMSSTIGKIPLRSESLADLYREITEIQEKINISVGTCRQLVFQSDGMSETYTRVMINAPMLTYDLDLSYTALSLINIEELNTTFYGSPNTIISLKIHSKTDIKGLEIYGKHILDTSLTNRVTIEEPSRESLLGYISNDLLTLEKSVPEYVYLNCRVTTGMNIGFYDLFGDDEDIENMDFDDMMLDFDGDLDLDLTLETEAVVSEDKIIKLPEVMKDYKSIRIKGDRILLSGGYQFSRLFFNYYLYKMKMLNVIHVIGYEGRYIHSTLENGDCEVLTVDKDCCKNMSLANKIYYTSYMKDDNTEKWKDCIEYLVSDESIDLDQNSKLKELLIGFSSKFIITDTPRGEIVTQEQFLNFIDMAEDTGFELSGYDKGLNISEDEETDWFESSMKLND
jgi:hypothetical protein